MIKSITIDENSKVLLFSIALGQLLFNNGFYLVACTTTFFVLFFYIQRKFYPGVFSIILIQHSIQITAGVWLANYLGNDINYRSAATSTATIASLIGLVVLFSPIVYFQRNLPMITREKLLEFASQLSIERTLNCYIAIFFITLSLSSVAFIYTGFVQIIVSLLKIKWMFFLLFGYQSILKNKKRNIFYFFIIFEFFSGFVSFFSDFKVVIYYLIVLIISLVGAVNFKQMLWACVVAGAFALFGLFWTSIKGDYRSFLNKGQASQTVQVSRDEAINKLVDLSNKTDEDDIKSSTRDLLDRSQYTYHFAKTIDRVPLVIPFQNGANWMQDLEFSTTPRFLNPDKPILDNSEKTIKYTGIKYAGRKQGVSYSLGYFAECYVDFGLYGMMLVILLIGIIYGKLYIYFLKNASQNLLFNFSLIGAFFMEFGAFEMDGTFLTGRFLSSLVTFFLLIKFVFPSLLKYIKARPERESVSTNVLPT